MNTKQEKKAPVSRQLQAADSTMAPELLYDAAVVAPISVSARKFACADETGVVASTEG